MPTIERLIFHHNLLVTGPYKWALNGRCNRPRRIRARFLTLLIEVPKHSAWRKFVKTEEKNTKFMIICFV